MKIKRTARISTITLVAGLFSIISCILLLGCGEEEVSINAKTSAQTTDQASSLPASQYPEVEIGSQTWMAKNLDVSNFNNGDPIPEAKTDAEWAAAGKAGKPTWSHYDNNPTNGQTYGKLYNWYAVNDPRGLAPQGWHVPTDAEWETLVNFLGGMDAAGGEMKEAGTAYWEAPNTGATNSSGFSALPAGARSFDDGKSNGLGFDAGFWSTTDNRSGRLPSSWVLGNRSSGVGVWGKGKAQGLSVRCVRD